MRLSTTTEAPVSSGADTIAIGVFADEAVAHDTPGGELGALVEGGEARSTPRALAVTHAAGLRWILVGLGDRATFDPERARICATAVLGRARELGTSVLCWEVPHHVDEQIVAALVEGTLLSAYRFEQFKRPRADEPPAHKPEALVLSAHHEIGAAAQRAATIARAQNAARDLQNRPANDLTPTALADRARELAAEHPALSVEVHGRDELEARGMGAFACVARGSEEEPALIVVRHTPPQAEGPVVGLVGKAVTFDTGGISIKPSAGMQGMKFDMSGGAAVLEALGAIAALELPVAVLAVIGATENMPDGRAVKPGDIVRAMDGTSIEVNNTDAEGRLVLADCLLLARELGAERLVDVATLTGGVVTALGSVHAGVMSNDDELWQRLDAAGASTGELVWRLPLHPRYAEAVEGVYADLTNTGRDRKAHPIMGGEFLHHFAGELPWAHVDIAGMADDNGLPYTPKGGAGWGVRLLVELVSAFAAEQT